MSNETVIPPEVIEGERMILRPITSGDTEDIIRWRNSESVRAHFIYREPFTVKSHEDWLQKEVETGNCAQWIICVKQKDGDPSPVGSVYIRNLRVGDPEYGIFIGEDRARGRGYGSEVCRLVCAYVSAGRYLKRMYLRVYTDNIAALRSYEAAGFRITGVMKGVSASDGSVADMYRMEVIFE